MWQSTSHTAEAALLDLAVHRAILKRVPILVQKTSKSAVESELSEVSAQEVFANRYCLEAMLARGGGGTVYRARDLQRDSTVALKIVDGRQANSFDVVRFRREYRALARLNHPCCLRVMETGKTAEGFHYLSMDYMPGGDLKSWSSRQVEPIVAVGLQVLAGLDHIHSKAIVHRDIKPQNILLREPPGPSIAVPKIVLADLGIAQVADLDDQMSAGRSLGTQAYIAPEQLESGLADPRSDLFSLGVLLYELLAGQAPWPMAPHTNAAEWTAQRRLAPPHLQVLRPELPGVVANTLMRLLEPDPQRRFVTPAAAYTPLHAWLSSVAPQFIVPLPPLVNAPYLAHAQFVGRNAELQTLRTAVANLASPQAAQPPLLICISGPAGIGKSKLLGQALRAAELSGVALEIGVCRSDPAPAFEPIASLMAELLPPTVAQSEANEDEDANKTQTGPPTSTETAQRLAALTANSKQDARWDLYRRLSDRLIELTLQVPLLVALEDAQWADASTLQFLTYVVRALTSARRQGQNSRILIVVTHRDTDADGALAELYRVATAEQALLTLPLQELSADSATQLVASMLMIDANQAVADLTTRLAEGSINNPLYLAQVLHALLLRGQLQRHASGWDLANVAVGDTHLPRTIRAAIGERAARMSVHTKQAMTAAAVVGRRFDFAGLMAITRLDEPLLLDSLDEALRGGFIEERAGEEGAYAFTHDRFREAIYESLPAPQRQTLHRAAAKAMTVLSPAAFADLAHHWRNCSAWPQAYSYALKAATQAVDNYAYVQAEAFFRDALSDAQHGTITVSAALHEAYADICNKTGHYEEAERIYRQRLQGNLEAPQRIALLRKLGQLEINRGTMLEAVRPLEDVLKMLQVPVPQTDLGYALGFVREFMGALLLCLPWTVRRTKRAGTQGARLEELASTYGSLATTLYFDNFMGAAYYTTAACRSALALGPSSVGVNNLAVASYGMAHIGLTRLSRLYMSISDRWNNASISYEVRGWALTMKAMVGLMEGKMATTVQYCREAQRLLTEARMPMIMRTSLMFEGEAVLVQGHFALARLRGEALWVLACEVDDREGRGFAKYILGDVNVRCGNAAAGFAQFAESVAFSARSGGTLSRIITQARWQLERALQGEAADACRVLDGELRELIAKGLRAWANQIFAAAVIVAVLQLQQTGSMTPEAAAMAKLALRRGRPEAKFIPALRPLMGAAEAFWDYVHGRPAAAHTRLASVLQEAEAWDMRGELFNVLRIACVVVPTSDSMRAMYEGMLTVLREAQVEPMRHAGPTSSLGALLHPTL